MTQTCRSARRPERELKITSGRFAANAAWLVLAVIAFNLTRAAASIAGTGLAKATTATIRRTLISRPAARIASSARRITLHLPTALTLAAPLDRAVHRRLRTTGHTHHLTTRATAPDRAEWNTRTARSGAQPRPHTRHGLFSPPAAAHPAGRWIEVNTDLPGFPDEDDLPATRGLATDLRRQQLADKPCDLSRDRDVGGKPTRTAGAPRAPRSGSGAAAPPEAPPEGPFCPGAADVDRRASRRSGRQHDDEACR